MKTIAIILTGGIGQRFNQKTPKQFITINQKTLLEYTLDVFQKNDMCDNIILVTTLSNNISFEKLKEKYSKLNEIVVGGKTRGDSIINATKALPDNEETFVVIHDACRPFISSEVINAGIEALKNKEIIKTVSTSQDDILIKDTKIVARNQYVILSSPDFIRSSLLKKLVSHDLYGLSCVFSAALKQNLDLDFKYIISNRENIKLTYPEDISLIRYYLKNSRQ